MTQTIYVIVIKCITKSGSRQPFFVSFWLICCSKYMCHESGCHSLQLHITHGLHLPSCTAHTHSHPPLHQSHSCHHSLINPDCLTTPAPHSLTRIKAAHKHSPSAKSCSPGYISEWFSQFVFPCTAWTVWLPLLIVCCLPLWPRLLSGNPLCLPPALTPCSASDFDSALSTLPSIPLLDICLFDLFVLIKLQVDLLSPLTSHLLQHVVALCVWQRRYILMSA